MLKFIANLFGIKPKAPVAPAPYKIETVVSEQAAQAVVESIVPTKKPVAKKKPAVKAKTVRKPKAPKA